MATCTALLRSCFVTDGLHSTFFMQHPIGPGIPTIYTCWLCGEKGMKDYHHHMKLENRQSRVANYHKFLCDVHFNEAVNIIWQGKINLVLIHSQKLDDDIHLESIVSEDSDGNDEVEGKEDQSDVDDTWGQDTLWNAIDDEDSSDDGTEYNQNQMQASTSGNPMIKGFFLLALWDSIAAVSSAGGTHPCFARAIYGNKTGF
ncbi:hypothetical protein DFH28DRAFT_1080495 [Melampsora americana]|nr:hypothetical protein DFH28DRAFT_1080495 [Melampsora americana]